MIRHRNQTIQNKHLGFATLSLQKFLKMISKKASESLVIMTEIVLPNDTNTFGNLMGGRLMYWMDIAAAISGNKTL